MTVESHDSEDPHPITIANRDQAEAAMAIVATITLMRQATQGEQNTQMILARRHDPEIKRLSDRLARYEEALVAWARKNRAEFGESKTLELRQGKISFRCLGRSVDFLRTWTEDLVLAKVRKLKRFAIYIRPGKQTLNRQLILHNTKPEVAQLKESELAEIGLTISRGESVSIEPKLEQLPI
jgi:phage host-nuclease inhibitor protein Gam